MAPTAMDETHEDAEFEEHGHQRNLLGWAARLAMFGALSFSAYQLYVAAFQPFSSLVTRSIHVSFLLFLIFMLYPATRKGHTQKTIPWYDILLSFSGFALGFYHYVFEGDLIERSGDPTITDLVVATLVTILVFEAARRVVGWALTLVCLTFLAYGFFGQYLPSAIAHRGYGYDQIIDQLYLGSDGILGTPILVSATYIFLFILFGTFLEHAGMIRLFNALALGLVGRAQGGPAKVAVISSGLMGTISGSGVANVLTVGQFTIPLMKKFGYSSIFAGAVEATSSMGGQIMPPVMGAVAFIMAETLNVPYADIVKAAVIPAVLYYATAFWMVHLEAGRLKLLGVPKEECPNVWLSLKENWYLALPLVALVYMLFHGFTPMFAGMMGLTLTSMLILGTALAARISMTALRYTFWFSLGLGAASFMEWGIKPVVGIIALLVIANALVKGGMETLHTMKMAMVNGAKQALGVGIACAIVGVIVGILTLTGAASSFAGFILEIGKTSLFLSLFLTMIACLLLGMGIPTIPNYIITSSIAAPALLKLGVPLIVSHMFVFYFGIMADLTPPVALAAFAAASIAKAPAMKIGFKAVQVAIAGFIIPYMAVYDPALMLQGDPTFLSVSYVLFKAFLAIFLWGGAAIGYIWAPLNLNQRILAVIAASCLVAALPISDDIGFALSACFIAWIVIQKMRSKA